jgi:hypothetical protein
MNADRHLRTLLAGMILAVLLSGPAVPLAQAGGGGDPGLAARQDSKSAGDQARDRARDRIQERIQNARDLTYGERASMSENLEALLRTGEAANGLDAVFPREGRGRQLSTEAMLKLQSRLRVMAQDGLPLEPVLGKVQEALMKGVPDAGLVQASQRVETQVREASRIVAQARADGIRTPGDPRREHQVIRDLAQQMWRGTSASDVTALLARARTRARSGATTMDDVVAASETATRLREEGVESRRAVQVASEALRQGYGTKEMRQLQYMLVYRHRQGRGVSGLVDEFERCLNSGMDGPHMYQYMMQGGWMGPGDMQSPGGTRPIDDQGRERGGPRPPGGSEPPPPGGGGGGGGGDPQGGPTRR